MNTIDRPDLDAALERRLRTLSMGQPSSLALTEIYDAVVLSTKDVRPRPRLLVSRANRRTTQPAHRAFSDRRVAYAVVATLLAVLAVGIGLSVGQRLMDNVPRRQTLPGAFLPAGTVPKSAGWLIRPALTVLSDGRILVAGGGQERALAMIFDPRNGTYAEPIDMPAIRQGATATTLPDGRVLIAGGNDGMTGTVLSTAVLFDPVAETFDATGPMSVPRDFHTATLLGDGRVLIVGGQDAPQATDGPATLVTTASTEIYDPSTGTFAPTGPLATTRSGHTATRLRNGDVLIVGGYSVSKGVPSEVATAEVFHPGAAAFRAVGALQSPRALHGAVLLEDGRVLVAGGGENFTPDGRPAGNLASAELFDPASGSFSPTGSLTTERKTPSMARLRDGRVLVIGGTNGFGTPRSAELFDPTTGTFELGPSSVGAHSDGLAALLADGRVFLAGAGEPPDGASELFDPTGTSTGVAASPGPARDAGPFRAIETTLRSEHTATRLLDGRVLIVGGYGGANNSGLATAELFDPASGTSSMTGSMAVPRSGHVATLLADGRVMVVGGGDSTGPRAEIFDSATGAFEPAGSEIVDAIGDRHPVPVIGLQAGRLILRDDESMMSMLDTSTGRLLPGTGSCRHAWGAIELADHRILIPCSHDPAIIYDPVAGTGVPAGFVGQFGSGLRLDDGRIVLASTAGGTVDAVYLVVTAVYDPATGVLTQVVPIDATSPKAGSLAAIGGGRILMFGGTLGNTSDSARLFDVSTWTASDLPSMLTPRADPTMTVLLDGRVLIVGGAVHSPDRADSIPPGAELFDPSRIP